MDRFSPAVTGVFTLFCFAFSSVRVDAQDCADDWFATVVSVQGPVDIKTGPQSQWSPAVSHALVCIGGQVRVGAFGRAAISLPDETVLRVDQNTTITFAPPQSATRTWLDIIKGAIHIIGRDPRALEVVTPFANAGLEGTEFSVRVTAEDATVTVLEGEVSVSNAAGATEVSSGQSILASAGQRPVPQTVVRPLDAVQWTLYYPAIVSQELPAADQAPSPEQGDDPKFFTARAASRLSSGAVEKAFEDLDKALSLDAGNSDALALQSIIAVSQNDKSAAQNLAKRAVDREPNSPAALLALSYSQQAQFDISGALATLQKAAHANTNDALVRARLAQIWLAIGNLRESMTVAQEAVDLDPTLALTQTIMGFAHLTRIETDLARAAFTRAIDLDQSAPLPRLGLGLALIREGQLRAGRELIGFAVILDPGNSLLRSYLGKAYHEENRNALAESQYRLAKQLDPLDPTPFYYDAIRKQSVNRPGGAMRDQQESVALNDNRAVYRSRLLLDEDLAARSASLGRIYRDLGFEQLALIQGWKSVNTDPGDFSGHRFLADTYSVLPRHQIARANELFLSQMLQPINITPIQPQLAETNLFVLDVAGPATIGFNEFNPMFNRDRLAVQVSGVGGGNDTSGQDGVIAGVWSEFSFSAGLFNYRTDGFRPNNDLDQEAGNVYLQWTPTYNLSLQAEVRQSEVDVGDLFLRFDPNNFNSLQREEEKVDTVRTGLRWAFGPRNDLLVSLVDQEAESTLTFPGFTGVGELRGRTYELQHIYKGESWHITTGGSYLNSTLDEELTLLAPPPPPPPVLPPMMVTQVDELETERRNLYTYPQFQFADRLTLTVGASYDELEGRTVSDDQINPKLGLIWEPGNRTIIRAAAFRTLQRPFVSKRNVQPSLEPTQMAGFNQFFFGAEGEDAWRYGVGIDQAWGEGWFAGAEFSMRDLEVPGIVTTPGPPPAQTTALFQVEEYFARAYLNRQITPHLSISLSYQYEEVDNNGQAFEDSTTELRTHRLPLLLSWFHPTGIGAGFKTTYVDQSGKFVPVNGPPVLEAGEDDFWVFDVALRYRLPRRRGLIELVANNVFDDTFMFQDTDPESAQISPERWVLLKATLAF